MTQQESIDIKVSGLVDKFKSFKSANVGRTVKELNNVVKPLYTELVMPTIDGLNSALKEKLGDEEAPVFKVVSNVELNQTDLNRNFIQIVFQRSDSDADFNPLTSPYLLIEGSPSGQVDFISSTFNHVEKLAQVGDIYGSTNEFAAKFNDSLQQFIDKI